jgi:hypothetical protein
MSVAYQLHFRRDYNTPKDFVIVGTRWFFTSLKEAMADRKVCGDLVVDYHTGRVINDLTWLWDWEQSNPECYAQKAMRHDNLAMKL